MREVSLALCDVAQNSIDAGARTLKIKVEATESKIIFTVEDDGEGMDEKTLSAATDSGMSTKNGAGLGLALLKEETGLADGRLEISSQKGKGTTVTAEYGRVEGVVLGDLGATAVTLADDGYDVQLTVEIFGRTKIMDTKKLKSASPTAELQSRGVLRLIREDINKFIRQNGGANL